MVYMQIEFEWIYLLYAGIIFLIYIGTRYILIIIRKKTISQLNYLLTTLNFGLYQELLNNKRLQLVFRKQALDIFRLHGYLLSGNEIGIEEMIEKLDQSSLEPFEKLDYYQKRFSYFIGLNDKKEAKNSLELLRSFIKKTDNVKVRAILFEAELVYEIYINHNTNLINDLIIKAQSLPDNIIKGITEYRIAKLYYFENNLNQVNLYLDKAKENVKGTFWYPIVLEAIKDHSVLALK